MPLFRFHRGGLAESLKTTVVVKSLIGLWLAIQEDYKDYGKFVDIYSIKIEKVGFDERIGWHSHIVTFSFHHPYDHPMPQYVAGYLGENMEIRQIKNYKAMLPAKVDKIYWSDEMKGRRPPSTPLPECQFHPKFHEITTQNLKDIFNEGRDNNLEDN